MRVLCLRTQAIKSLINFSTILRDHIYRLSVPSLVVQSQFLPTGLTWVPELTRCADIKLNA
jgi:hypothetical protein